MELNPTATEPALELAGAYTSSATITPVIFRVASPVELKTERNDVTITTNNGYSALTTLNLSLLGAGITQTMLDNAVRTNGTILITSSINTALYNIILNNLKDSDEVDFEDD